MNIKELKSFSQNIHKNHLLTEVILENNKNFDILFIQEPSWLVIRSILSVISAKREEVVRAPNHLL